MQHMSAQIIDGKILSDKIKHELAQKIQKLRKEGIIPGLAVILVGANPASQIYVHNKIKACEQVGIHSIHENYSDQISEQELISHIQRLNADKTIHGILVQLPLPHHIDSRKIIETIDPAKDVDAFHVVNVGALQAGLKGFRPCTPSGCMKMLESINYSINGKNAVVVGRSNIVGKPIALMLLEKNATVTICHSATPDLKHFTKEADILIAAVGKAKFITADMVKPGAVVIDVGMNRDGNGKLCGDVDFESVSHLAGWITPVPGGVGPMTIAMLLENTVTSALQKLQMKAAQT